MSRIDKEAIKEKKEAKRAIQYPRVLEPVVERAVSPVREPATKKSKEKSKK